MPQLAVTDKIKSELKKLYPSVDVDSIKLYGSENNTSIYIDSIIVPRAYRAQGIGKEIFRQLKQHANKVQKPIVLSPQAEPGYEKNLIISTKDLVLSKIKAENTIHHFPVHLDQQYTGNPDLKNGSIGYK